MPYLTTKDNTQIHYKDWGNPKGQPVLFSHGWPLSSDAWESQMHYLATAGYRCVAHDRRGFGRSSQPWGGNDMDTYADDLLALLDYLDLREGVTLVGHSTGGGEVVRLLGRHGSGDGRVVKAVLVGSVTPGMVRKGMDVEVFNAFRTALLANKAQFFIDVPTGPFFGFNRPGAEVSQGLIDDWWRQAMQSGLKNAYECVKAFSEIDMTEDMKKIDIPTLILHGDDDQVVPIENSAREGIKLLKNGILKIYPGAPHALPQIQRDMVNQDLLDFLREKKCSSVDHSHV